MANSHTTQMTPGTKFENMVFSNLHLNNDSYMHFTSILRLPAFSLVTNMTYNRAATKRQQA